MEEQGEIEVIESRITAGSISDIIDLREIERVGYLESIVEMIIKKEKKFVHSLEFYTDTYICVYDILVIENDNIKRLFKLEDINKALKKEGFYIANFHPHFFLNEIYNHTDENQAYFFGTGDLYEEKKISLGYGLNIPRIKLPKDFDLLNN